MSDEKESPEKESPEKQSPQGKQPVELTDEDLKQVAGGIDGESPDKAHKETIE
jgi:hypothetical protein